MKDSRVLGCFGIGCYIDLSQIIAVISYDIVLLFHIDAFDEQQLVDLSSCDTGFDRTAIVTRNGKTFIVDLKTDAVLEMLRNNGITITGENYFAD